MQCVPETWGRTNNVLPRSAQGLRKWDEKLDSHAGKKGTKKIVSSNCTNLSCLLSRTYQTGCDGCDDCDGPRSNAVDQATQVSQQSTRYQGHEAELVVNVAELVGSSFFEQGRGGAV